MRRFRLAHYLKSNLWVLPMICVFAGVVLSVVTTSIDPVGSLVPQSVTGDTTAAMQVLYIIAFAMLTLTGLVLSLLVVAVQLAMGTFSPRIVRQILHDRPSQAAIGLFGATFAHAMLSMRAVHTRTDGGTVPGLAVVVSVVLVFGCIAALIWYLNHITQSLRTAALVGWVADDAMAALDRIYTDHGDVPDVGPQQIATPHSGVLFAIGHDRLVRLASRADCRFEMLWSVGDFVPTGAPIVRIVGDHERVDPAAITKALVFGPERTLNQDAAYGLRMLVDIAERCLSSGPFEDPTTAVQAIDRLHDILRQLVHRPLHTGHYHDDDGVLRLTVPTLHWDGFVRLAFDEIRLAGSGSPQVARRLRAALQDLLTVAPPERQSALRRQLSLLTDRAVATSSSEEDKQAALQPDPAGIGSAAELVRGSTSTGGRASAS